MYSDETLLASLIVVGGCLVFIVGLVAFIRSDINKNKQG